MYVEFPPLGHDSHYVGQRGRIPEPLRHIDGVEEGPRLKASLDDHGVEIAGSEMHALRAHNAITVRYKILPQSSAHEEPRRMGREGDFCVFLERPEFLKVVRGERRKSGEGNKSGAFVDLLAILSDGFAAKPAAPPSRGS